MFAILGFNSAFGGIYQNNRSNCKIASGLNMVSDMDLPDQSLYLVAGLGNPGCDYADTRHNTGFMVIDLLAAKYNIAVDRRKFDLVYGRSKIEGVNTILAKPQTFMNRSGLPLQRLAHFLRIQRETMVIVHDDIDLRFSRLKIKEKGGDGGHKGIRSVIDAFGSGQFCRVRVGIGRPVVDANVTNHVLNRFDDNERQVLNELLERASQAVVTILRNGPLEGMNRFNQNPH